MSREAPVRFREGPGVKFPRATRLVICCRGTADEAMTAMRAMMTKLRLTVNEAKTRLRRVPEETFDFLGYTIGRCYAPQTGKAYLGTRPSAKVIRRLCREVSEWTGRRWAWAQRGGAGRAAQQETGGLGELLLSGPGPQGVSGRGQAHLPPAPPVVACQAPGSDPGILTLSQRVAARCAGTGSPEGSTAQPSVCEGVSSCPRAGCLNRARPVR